MAGTVSGAIKGWITRKLREKDPNLNFEIVTGLVVAEDITDVEDFLTEQMVEDYGIDKEYLKDKRIYYEDGDWKANLDSLNITHQTWIHSDEFFAESEEE